MTHEELQQEELDLYDKSTTAEANIETASEKYSRPRKGACGLRQMDLFTNRLPYISGLGIPYMGSKRKLAPKIVDFILAENPQAKYVFDLFGGGGAMSFEFLQRHQIERVVYNDLDGGVVSLLRDIWQNGVTEKYLQWVDRATFHEHKNGNDWFSGFVKTCWSFGCNCEKGYLFSEENERLKRPLHLAIVEKDEKYLKDFEEISGIQIPSELLDFETINERRLKVMGFVKKNKNTEKRIELQQLEQLQQLQQLQNLQHLERLEQLQRLQQLEISNGSYSDVVINTPISETVIYLDPPYVNTTTYQKKLSHDELYSWIEKSPYKIYLSSYESHLPCVAEFEHRSTLSASNNSKKVSEKIFCNMVK